MTTCVLAACGGGGGGGSSSTTPSVPPTQAVTTQAVPAGGGTVSVTLGSQTATITAPAGAFAAGATLKVTLYLTSALPVTLSRARRTAQSVPSAASPLAGLVIDAGGATLTAPLQVTITGAGAPGAGTTALIAGYANGSFDDVAATTYGNSGYSTVSNPDYPGLTLAAQTLYVLYSVPTAGALTPAAAVTVAGAATVSTATTATYTATEATTNGFPFFGKTFAFSLDNATLGTIVASTGVLTGGGIGGTGNVIATDTAVSAFTGKLAVGVTTARPGTNGLTEQYTGTMSTVDANDIISNSPVTISSTAAATVNVSSAAANDGSGNVIFTAAESDASNLETLSATTVSTVAYQSQNSGSVGVRALKTVATESSGVVYEHDYGSTNGLLTVLPEVAGTFSNDASEEYKETDPGIGIVGGVQGVTTDRVVASSGTYTQTVVEPDTQTGAAKTDTMTESSNFSGLLTLNSYDPGPLTYAFAAPASNNINVTINDANAGVTNVVIPIPGWMPVQASPSVETDAISATSLDPSCAPSSTFSGSPILIAQTVKIVDAVNGTFETRTTKTYDINGVGTVCSVYSDLIQTYYDYSGQEGPFIVAFTPVGQPILQTTVTETLSLKTSNAAQVDAAKRSQSVGPVALFPASLVSGHVQYLARARQAAKIAAFRMTTGQLPRAGVVK